MRFGIFTLFLGTKTILKNFFFEMLNSIRSVFVLILNYFCSAALVPALRLIVFLVHLRPLFNLFRKSNQF